jgi:hypothetical protein
MNYPLSIPKLIEQAVDRVRTAKLAELQAYDPTIETIAYMYGNIREIIKLLNEKTQNDELKYKKYPLFILIEDIQIDRRNTSFYGTPTLNIIICNHTLNTYTSEQREAINFTNILRPLYEEFLMQLFKQKGFVIQNWRTIDHLMTERKFWGANEQTNNKLGDYIDAIEIEQMRFPIDWAACQTIINSTI